MLIDKFIESIKSHIDFKQVKVICDIGSRDLEQSMELHSVFPNAHIHAFEPNPESYEKCKAKASEYVTVYPYALLDYDGETTFYSVIQKDNHGASSVFEPTEYVVGVDKFNGLERIVVPCRRLDSVLHEPIDLVWQDVQGTELPTLIGYGALLDTVKAIATEAETGALYFGNRKYEPTQYEVLKQFMESKGFTQVAYDQPWALECDVVFARIKK